MSLEWRLVVQPLKEVNQASTEIVNARRRPYVVGHMQGGVKGPNVIPVRFGRTIESKPSPFDRFESNLSCQQAPHYARARPYGP
jgi:hypothetical protein